MRRIGSIVAQEPLKTKKACTIFVGDMFDLFHEAIPDEMLATLNQARTLLFSADEKKKKDEEEKKLAEENSKAKDDEPGRQDT